MSKKLYSIEVLDNYTYFSWQVLEDSDEYALSLIVGADDERYYTYEDAFSKAVEWLVSNGIDMRKHKPGTPLNPENCFCQSQYCNFKQEDMCTKYNKRIIGTAECDGFDMEEDV